MANELKERWETEDGKKRLQRIVEAIQKGQEDWPDILSDFPKVKDVENNRDLRWADLSGKSLQEADLSNVRFDHANLSKVNLAGANLRGANLPFVVFCDADLKKTDLSRSYLKKAEFINADIRGAIFHAAKLVGDFIAFGQGSIAANVDFSGARYNRKTSFVGVDISRNNWATNPLLKRHIEDQQWLYVWRNKNWFNKHLLHRIWFVSCDCGRSFLLWAFWSLGLAVAFGFVYRYFAASFIVGGGGDKTLADAHWFTPFYYSIVTFTTLGFGDVVPQSANGSLQFYVTIEVILGYIMLGGLISILANKLARRA